MQNQKSGIRDRSLGISARTISAENLRVQNCTEMHRSAHFLRFHLPGHGNQEDRRRVEKRDEESMHLAIFEVPNMKNGHAFSLQGSLMAWPFVTVH